MLGEESEIESQIQSLTLPNQVGQREKPSTVWSKSSRSVSRQSSLIANTFWRYVWSLLQFAQTLTKQKRHYWPHHVTSALTGLFILITSLSSWSTCDWRHAFIERLTQTKHHLYALVQPTSTQSQKQRRVDIFHSLFVLYSGCHCSFFCAPSGSPIKKGSILYFLIVWA